LSDSGILSSRAEYILVLRSSGVGKIDKPPDATTACYRGDRGKAVAERIAKLLPDPPAVKEIEKKGWVDVIVVLRKP
jgi:hypothetical protein